MHSDQNEVGTLKRAALQISQTQLCFIFCERAFARREAWPVKLSCHKSFPAAAQIAVLVQRVENVGYFVKVDLPHFSCLGLFVVSTS